MYENRFTPRAQSALRLAQEAAEELGHSYVGSEHLLLGLMREEGGAAVTPLGGVSRERWLYLGPGETALQLGDRADCGDLALAVQQARQVFWGDAPVYWWATLRRRKEEGHEQCH